jgi:FkbM family methyltransferase
MHGEYLHSDFLKHINAEVIRTIFEAGAREGNDSVALSKYYKNSQVYSFECNPYTVNVCKETVRGYPNVHFNDFGLGNVIETRQFYPYLLHGNTGASSFLKRIDYAETQRDVENIKIDTIENFCKNAGISSIDLLCMDTQGYELNILKGCGTILSTIKHIIIEEPRANAQRKYIGSPSHTEIQTFLQENGFSETARVFENALEDNVMYSRM